MNWDAHEALANALVILAAIAIVVILNHFGLF